MASGFISKSIHQQGVLLLNKPYYAYFVIALLAILPFSTWLAMSVIALISLRKGAQDGMIAVSIGMASVFLSMMISDAWNFSNFLIVFLTFLPCYLMALLLRLTVQWELVYLTLLLLASCCVLFFYFNTPDLLVAEYQELQVIVDHFKESGMHFPSWLVDRAHMLSYLLGIQATSFFLSTIAALMLARAMQAKLFYPTGFKQEMLSLKIYAWSAVPFLIIAFGLYQHHPLALSLTPIWLVYTFSAGMSVLVCLFASHRVVITSLLLLIATAFLPIVMIPIVTLAGITDSFIHFRTRSTSKKSNRSS